MAVIIDNNGIKYNPISITYDLGAVSGLNYMCSPDTNTALLSSWDNLEALYTLDILDYYSKDINTSKTWNFDFLGYKGSLSISFIKTAKEEEIRAAIETHGNIVGDNLTNTTYNSNIYCNIVSYYKEELKIIPVAYIKNNKIVGISINAYIAYYFKNGFTTIAEFNSNNAIGVVFDYNYNNIIISNNDNHVSYREFDNAQNTEQSGGYGVGSMPTDNIDIPTLPVINMADTGATLYSLTPLQMKNFRSWLWTTDWVDNLKKIRTDPMQNIIGISIADVPISAGLNALIYVGNVASTVEANVISNSFIELDCGEITLDEYYGTFADYEPFVATTLYLPKVGFVQIPADVCVNNTIKVVYHIELSSGEGLCYVQLTSKRDGFSYIWNTYTCHVTSNITLSAQDHSQQLVALGNAIINTGISASNAIINPSSATQGLTNTMSSCIDVATTKNPTSTKGNVGNMSAVMCYKKPYLLINRTNLTKPASFQENNGYLINYSSTIGNHTGFLKTRDFHAEFNAPYSHKVELERIMNEGVFING